MRPIGVRGGFVTTHHSNHSFWPHQGYKRIWIGPFDRSSRWRLISPDLGVILLSSAYAIRSVRSNYLELKILLSSPCEVIVFTPCPILFEIGPLVGLMMSYHFIGIRKNVREFHPFCFSCSLLFGSTFVEPLGGAALARNRQRRTIDQLYLYKLWFVLPCSPAL